MLTSFLEMWDGKLGEMKGIEHQIRLAEGGKLFRSQYYEAEPRARQVVQKSVDDMLISGVIFPSYSKWSSHVFLVPNSDGSLRFCVDYGKLNAITVRDTYSISRMDECRDSSGDATVYSALDCNFAYWQIPVAEEKVPKMTVTCHGATYLFRRMPFGLLNASATIQRMLDTVLFGYRWKRRLI